MGDSPHLSDFDRYWIQFAMQASTSTTCAPFIPHGCSTSADGSNKGPIPLICQRPPFRPPVDARRAATALPAAHAALPARALARSFLELNPLGTVPLLDPAGDVRMTESAAMCQYLPATHPDAGWMCRPPTQRMART